MASLWLDYQPAELRTSTVLYRLFDQQGHLLYVGITRALAKRMRAHKAVQPWWSKVATLRLEYFATRQDAETAEKVAIHEEGPAFNIAHHPTNRSRPRPLPEERWLPENDDERRQRRAELQIYEAMATDLLINRDHELESFAPPPRETPYLKDGGDPIPAEALVSAFGRLLDLLPAPLSAGGRIRQVPIPS